MTMLAYRCTECGKWSHAKRKPKWHQRFTRDKPEVGAVVIRYEPPTYDREGNGDDGGYMIRCGPFATYGLKAAADV